MDQNNQISAVGAVKKPQNIILKIIGYIFSAIIIIIMVSVFLGMTAILLGFLVSVWPILIVGAILATISFIYYDIKQKKANAIFIKFASANGFSFKNRGLPANLNWNLFCNSVPYCSGLVSGKIQNTPFNLFNCKYRTGSGKNSYINFRTIVFMDMTYSLPTIFLAAIGGSFMLNMYERVKLEGDFDKYFDLFVKKDFEVEALQIFTPDFMEKIVDNWKKLSVQFSGSQIYIHSENIITNDQDLQNIYQYAQYLVSKIEPIAKELSRDVDVMREYFKE